MPIQGVYALNGIALLALAAGLLARLWRRGAWVPLAGLVVALVGTSCWFVPLSLEYTWVFLLMLAAVYVGYVHHRERTCISGKLVALYLAIGLVPFARFAVLDNHSYIHYFFTFRLLAATLLAVVLALGEIAYEGRPHGVAGKHA